MTDGPLDCEDLVDHYRRCLGYLQNHIDILTDPSDRKNKEILREAEGLLDYESSDFTLSPRLAFDLSESSGRDDFLLIGSEFEVEDSELISYSLDCWVIAEKTKVDTKTSCCPHEDVSENYVAVKGIHFDMQRQDDQPDEPMWHIQFSGRLDLDPDHRGLEIHNCTFDRDEPRIPYPPMDLILVLDLMMEEYQSLQKLKTGTGGNWEGMVNRSKNMLWEENYPPFLINN